jgi:hypothetical protein
MTTNDPVLDGIREIEKTLTECLYKIKQLRMKYPDIPYAEDNPRRLI